MVRLRVVLERFIARHGQVGRERRGARRVVSRFGAEVGGIVQPPVAVRRQPRQVGVAEPHAQEQRRGLAAGGVGAQQTDRFGGGHARIVGVVGHRRPLDRAAAPALELGRGVRFCGLQDAEALLHQAAVGSRLVAACPFAAVEVVRAPGGHLAGGRVPGRFAPARRIGLVLVQHLVQAHGCGSRRHAAARGGCGSRAAGGAGRRRSPGRRCRSAARCRAGSRS